MVITGDCSLCGESVTTVDGAWRQPVPAGHIRRITLDRNPNGSWSLLLNGLGRVAAHEVVYLLTRPPILRQQIDEALQMAMFTRHPAVKPEPKLRTWFGNEEEP